MAIRSPQTHAKRWRKVGLVVAAILGYVLIFIPAYHSLGGVAGSLSFIPAVLAGWLLGMSAGISVALLTGVATVSLLAWVSEYGLADTIRLSSVGLLLVMLAGGLTGKVRDLLMDLRRSAARMVLL